MGKVTKVLSDLTSIRSFYTLGNQIELNRIKLMEPLVVGVVWLPCCPLIDPQAVHTNYLRQTAKNL